MAINTREIAKLPLWQLVFQVPYLPKMWLSYSLAPWRELASGERIGAGDFDDDPAMGRLIKAEIDFDDGRFRYAWERSGTLAFRPWDYSPEPPTFWRASPELWSSVAKHAESTWSQMAHDFGDAVADGEISLFARVGSALAAHTAIPAGAWAHFSVTNWWTGEARNEAGEHLFQIIGHAESRAPLTGPERAALDQEFDRWEDESVARTGFAPSRAECEAWAINRGLGREWGRQKRSDSTAPKRPLGGQPRNRPGM